MNYKLIFIVLAAVCYGCTAERPHYVVGVSQCSQDIWREKQNDELQMAAYLHEGVELRFAAAYDSDERQVQQIDSLVDTGIDLLIVAPNQMATITPAIDRAYDKGIPVIVFERKTDSKKYTAFISADNYEMGRQMGLYIAAQLHGRGHVLEIEGLKGSSPAIERHKGFCDALSGYPDIQLVASLQGDWTEQSAVTAVNNYQGDLTNIDFVFGQNDRMAVGARKALKSKTSARPEGALVPEVSRNLKSQISPKFCGIDGLPNKGGGIECVQQGILDATYIYPTRGDMVLQLAMDMLEGRPYERENRMKSAIVTRENAAVTLMQAEEMNLQHDKLKMLHQKTDWYLTQYRHQQVYMVLMGVIILLVVAGAWFVFTAMRRRHQLEREAYALVVSEREAPLSSPEGDTNVQGAAKASPRGGLVGAPGAAKASPRGGLVGAPGAAKASPRGGLEGASALTNPPSSKFLEQLRQRGQEHIADSDFSVETLAADMGMSRVQLYRKVKQLTGHTPVDIIRESRLNRAKVLLSSTDLTISEVTYQVGFTAPSYFTKCFKEEFGILPGEVRK